MDHLLSAASLSHCAFAYVDDVLVHSPTPEQHIIDVSAVLDAMGRNGYTQKNVSSAQTLYLFFGAVRNGRVGVVCSS